MSAARPLVIIRTAGHSDRGLICCSPVALSDSDAEATVKNLDKIAKLAILLAVAVLP
jgi:hypothetical protein